MLHFDTVMSNPSCESIAGWVSRPRIAAVWTPAGSMYVSMKQYCIQARHRIAIAERRRRPSHSLEKTVLADGLRRYCIYQSTGEKRVFGGRDTAGCEPGLVISQGSWRSFFDPSTGTTSQPKHRRCLLRCRCWLCEDVARDRSSRQKTVGDGKQSTREVTRRRRDRPRRSGSTELVIYSWQRYA